MQPYVFMLGALCHISLKTVGINIRCVIYSAGSFGFSSGSTGAPAGFSTG